MPMRTSRSVGFGISSSSDTAAITMPAVQYPHCRPWCSWNAGLHRVPLVAVGETLDRGHASQPSAWAASIVHDFTDSPSTSTVHAPHDDVSQPTFVPVSPHASRRNCTSSVRGSTRGACAPSRRCTGLIADSSCAGNLSRLVRAAASHGDPDAAPGGRAPSRRGSRPSRDARRRRAGSTRRGRPSPRAGARSRPCPPPAPTRRRSRR